MNINIVKNVIKNISYNDLMKFKQKHNDDGSKNVMINNKGFIFIGKGGEGYIYKYDDIAIKFYKNNKSAKNELNIMNKFNVIIKEHISNNFLEIYDHITIYNHDIVFMECMDGNLEEWTTEYHEINEWKSMIIQILYGLLVMQYCTEIFHNDMKPKNILFKRIKKQNIRYIINEKIITFETEFIFKIADFGHSQCLTETIKEEDKQYIKISIKNNLDLYHLASFHNRLLVDAIHSSHTLNDLLNMGKTIDKFEDYVKNERDVIKQNMTSYDQRTRDKMLFRSLTYFLIEHNKFDYDNVPNFTKYILPIKDIRNILDSLNFVKEYDGIIKKIEEISIHFNELGNDYETFILKIN